MPYLEGEDCNQARSAAEGPLIGRFPIAFRMSAARAKSSDAVSVIVGCRELGRGRFLVLGACGSYGLGSIVNEDPYI